MTHNSQLMSPGASPKSHGGQQYNSEWRRAPDTSKNEEDSVEQNGHSKRRGHTDELSPIEPREGRPMLRGPDGRSQCTKNSFSLERHDTPCSETQIDNEEETCHFITAGIGALVIRAHIRYEKWKMYAATTINSPGARQDTNPSMTIEAAVPSMIHQSMVQETSQDNREEPSSFISAEIGAQDNREEPCSSISDCLQLFTVFSRGSSHGHVGDPTYTYGWRRTQSRRPWTTIAAGM